MWARRTLEPQPNAIADRKEASEGHMSRHRRFKDTDLFLVRMWAEEVTDASGGDEQGPTEWRGKVQRVVDGESYQFDNWQTLVDLLRAMFSAGAGGIPESAGEQIGWDRKSPKVQRAKGEVNE